MRRIISTVDCWSNDPGEEMKFLHAVVSWTDGNDIHISLDSRRAGNIPDEDVETMVPHTTVDPNDITAPWRPEFTEAPNPPPHNSYIKIPATCSYLQDRARLGGSLPQEAEIYEILAKHGQHPNICTYYGSVRKGDRIRALCLRRYEKTLTDVIYKGLPFDRKAALKDIRCGVEHLHSLGLVHCDLKPSNIMFDEHGTAVIIDFDSCTKKGSSLEGTKCGGTIDWELPYVPETAQPEIDWYFFGLLEQFLNGEI